MTNVVGIDVELLGEKGGKEVAPKQRERHKGSSSGVVFVVSFKRRKERDWRGKKEEREGGRGGRTGKYVGEK